MLSRLTHIKLDLSLPKQERQNIQGQYTNRLSVSMEGLR